MLKALLVVVDVGAGPLLVPGVEAGALLVMIGVETGCLLVVPEVEAGALAGTERKALLDASAIIPNGTMPDPRTSLTNCALFPATLE